MSASAALSPVDIILTQHMKRMPRAVSAAEPIATTILTYPNSAFGKLAATGAGAGAFCAAIAAALFS